MSGWVYSREKATSKKRKDNSPWTAANKTATQLGYAAKIKMTHEKEMAYFCGRFTFAVFEIVLHF